MGTSVRDYSLALVQVIYDDFRVQGWAGDDAATLTPMSDLFESESSTDGTHVAMNRINDNRWELTLSVRRGSTGFKLLADAAQAQLAEAAVGAVAAKSMSLYDPISGDKVVEEQARFMRLPDMGFGKAAGVAEFKLLLPNPAITFGGNIATSV